MYTPLININHKFTEFIFQFGLSIVEFLMIFLIWRHKLWFCYQCGLNNACWCNVYLCSCSIFFNIQSNRERKTTEGWDRLMVSMHGWSLFCGLFVLIYTRMCMPRSEHYSLIATNSGKTVSDHWPLTRVWNIWWE